jgi:hypothetical protein
MEVNTKTLPFWRAGRMGMCQLLPLVYQNQVKSSPVTRTMARLTFPLSLRIIAPDVSFHGNLRCWGSTYLPYHIVLLFRCCTEGMQEIREHTRMMRLFSLFQCTERFVQRRIVIMQSQNIYFGSPIFLLTCPFVVKTYSPWAVSAPRDHLIECEEMGSGVINLIIVVHKFDQLRLDWWEALPEAWGMLLIVRTANMVFDTTALSTGPAWFQEHDDTEV